MNPEKKTGQHEDDKMEESATLDLETVRCLEFSVPTPGPAPEPKNLENIKIKRGNETVPFTLQESHCQEGAGVYTDRLVKPIPFKKPTSPADPVARIMQQNLYQISLAKLRLSIGVTQPLQQIRDKQVTRSAFGHTPSLGTGLIRQGKGIEQMQPQDPHALRPFVRGRGTRTPGKLEGPAANIFNESQGLKFGTLIVQGRGKDSGRTSQNDSTSYQALQLPTDRFRQLALARKMSHDNDTAGLSPGGCAVEYGLTFSSPPNKKGRLVDDAECKGIQPKSGVPDKCDRERYQVALLQLLLDVFKVNKP